MSQRADEVRKRIASRRKQFDYDKKRQKPAAYDHYDYSEETLDEALYESDSKHTFHPLWNRDMFLFKILGSAVLVLLTAVIFQSPAPVFDQAKTSVKNVMEKEFQFATVASWYEDKFGKPLALLPSKIEGEPISTEPHFATPVAGKVLEQFSGDGRGIILETGTGAEVEAMSGGVVIFAGKKEDIGNTVIIEHPDQSESWYGNLDVISVKPREQVVIGKVLGTVSDAEDGTTGEFYFAIKQEENFIDPIQVMKFE